MTTEEDRVNIVTEHFGEPVLPRGDREARRQEARQEHRRATRRVARIGTAPLALGGAALVLMQVVATVPSALWLVVGLLMTVPFVATFTVKL